MDRPISLTIGTAGHVDHGKTTLVQRMTGTDTDRLEEEHRRGISILPGYAELELPGGRKASLIDVPGHERFVKNMVSGSTGVDAFLLVVAADDGVMPQTREHLDVLHLLGVDEGVVALTKIDVVDGETADLARLEVEELLEEYGLDAPVHRVSGATGEGVDGLLEALDGISGGLPGHEAGALARLPVDRSFVLKGVGLIATGTLWSGTLRPGDTIYSSSGRSLRVRSVQNHGRQAEAAYPGARTALNLTGADASEIEAGDLLLSERVESTRALDTRLYLLENAEPLGHGSRVRFYHGTRHVNARVRLADRRELAPGDSARVRLMLGEPLVVLSRDRFVIRSLSPQFTVGGGTVLDFNPQGRRPDPDWLSALEEGDAARIVPLALSREPRSGMNAEELARAIPLPREKLVAAAESSLEIKRLGEIYLLVEEAESAGKRLLDALRNRARENPEIPELSVAGARTATGLAPRLADALLAGPPEGIEVSDSGVSLPGAGGVSAELEEEAARLLRALDEAAHEPPALEEGPALRLLLRRGEAVRLTGSLVVSQRVEEGVFDEIRRVCEEEGDLTLAGFRDLMGTSRRYAQAWLEHADTAGITRRIGDVRRLTRRHRE